VGQHLMLFENPVESRFRGQINTLVGKLGYDLLGRKIPERRTVGYVQYLLPLIFAELICWCFLRPLALILAPTLISPSNDRASTDPYYGSGFFQASTGFNGLINKIDDHFPLLPVVGSSASPQISWTFFLSTNNAAVSARALSFRRSSFSRARMRF